MAHPVAAPLTTEPATTSRVSARFYRPELDWIRFAAFVAVFVHHAFPTTSKGAAILSLPDWLTALVWPLVLAGGYGVDLFFALSSFLITELLLQEKEVTGRVHIKAFYIRRILRIWPLYFVFIAVIAAYEIAHGIPPSYYIALLAFAGNWHTVILGSTASLCAPLWSVSLEEQFYIVWPNLVSRVNPKRFAWIMLGMLAFTCIYRAGYVYVRPKAVYDVWCQTFTRLDAFAMGGLLACFLHNRNLVLPRAARLAALVSALGLFWWLGTYPEAGNFGVYTVWTYPAAAFASILCILSMIATSPKAAYGKPLQLLAYLGKISYGLYVYHMTGLFLSRHILLEGPESSLRLWVWRALLAGVITLTLSAISYAVLEKPFLRLKRRFAYVQSRPE